MNSRQTTPNSLTEDQTTVLNVIFHAGWRTGVWPKFASIDRPLYRNDVDAQAVLPTLTPKYVRRDGSSLLIQPDESLRLTLHGVNVAYDHKKIIPNFLLLLDSLVRIELDHEPSPKHLSPSFSYREALRLFSSYMPLTEATPIARGLGLLIYEEPYIWDSFARRSNDDWEITISSQIRRYRDVRTINDYFAQSPPREIESERVTTPDEFESESEEKGMTEGTVDPRSVFIVHGRDLAAKSAVSEFVRALDLRPVEWEEMIKATGSASPYTGHVVTLAFRSVHAVIVLLTPDDVAHLHEDLQHVDDEEWERTPTGQARPNVLFEAGIAMATHPDRTVIVEMGKTRPFSDVAGRNTIRLTGAPGALNALAERLQNSGCLVNRSGTDWLEPARFEKLQAFSRKAPNRSSSQKTEGNLPVGKMLPSKPMSAEPRLTARLIARGKDYLLEIANRGGVSLRNVSFEFKSDEKHWHAMTSVLPVYPIPVLEPREHIRIPLVLTWGGGVFATISLRALTPDESPFIASVKLSIYG